MRGTSAASTRGGRPPGEDPRSGFASTSRRATRRCERTGPTTRSTLADRPQVAWARVRPQKGRFRVRAVEVRQLHRDEHEQSALSRQPAAAAGRQLRDRTGEAMAALSGEYAEHPDRPVSAGRLPGLRGDPRVPARRRSREGQDARRRPRPSRRAVDLLLQQGVSGPAEDGARPSGRSGRSASRSSRGASGTSSRTRLASRRDSPHAFATAGWCLDYDPDPYAFLNVQLDGNTIQDEHNTNLSYFDDPAYNRRLERAATLVGDARLRAYAALEHDLVTKAAPWAAWGQPDEPVLLQRLRRHAELRLPADLRDAALQPAGAEVRRLWLPLAMLALGAGCDRLQRATHSRIARGRSGRAGRCG